MTTTRPVYANSNFTINSNFYKYAFKKNADSLYDYLGDIQRVTKNESIVSYYNRNFSLLGDPTIKLTHPASKVQTVSINGKAVGTPDTIKALQKVNVKGQVTTPKGILDEAFNGKLLVTIFDKASSSKTLGDKGEKPFVFNSRNSVIFEGEVEVKQGKFEVEFIVPKDISYSYGIGKISYYAVNTEGKDATGYFYDFYIGGGLNGLEDHIGPDLMLFANDTNFVSGGVTDSSPLFIAYISDLSGVNTTNTGVGHEMVLMIDDDFRNSFVLNDFYRSINNSFTDGVVEYPLYNLSPGTHKLTFKVWDVNNNSSTRDLYINVSQEGILSAYPNPFVDNVKFQFEQPREDIGGQAELKIYNSLGTQIWNQIFEYENFTSVPQGVEWDGATFSGEESSDGIYFVELELRYTDGLGNVTEKSKLIKYK
jgi:hypothetical protein